MFSFLRKHIVGTVLFVSLLLIYIHNLSRSVYGGDVGDLVTAAYVGGVAHPPGYPLFTLLGFLLTKLSLGQTPAFMVGLISAFSAACAVTVIYLMIQYLTKHKIVALLTSLILAFSYLFWLYAEVAEVFALHVFLTILLLFLGILYYKTKKLPYLYTIALFVGLSLTHHHTIILIFPSLFILVIGNLWKILKTRKRVVPYLLGFFLCGFSIYLYVPIAAAQNPPINWENVESISSFMDLFLRKAYGTFNAGTFAPPSFAQRLVILKTYSSVLFSQLTPVITIICVIGIGALIRKQRTIGIALLTGYLLAGPAFIFYAAFPLDNPFYLGISERFFLMSFAIFILFFPFGLLFVADILRKIFIRPIYRQLFIVVFFIIPLHLFVYNFPKTNLSFVMDGDYLGYDILFSAPKNAVVFVTGDTQVFNVWYAHYALGFRPDTTVININTLVTEPYFIKELEAYKKKYPQRIKDKDLIPQVVRSIASQRPIVSFSPLLFIDKDIKHWVPYGLNVELTQGKNVSEEEFTQKTEATYASLRFLQRNTEKTLAHTNFTIMDIPEYYANAYVTTGIYYLEIFNNKKKAEEYFLRAEDLAPEFVKAHAVLGTYYLYYTNNCKDAEKYLTRAIELSIVDKKLYTLLYYTYKDCLHDVQKAEKVVAKFNNQFNADFFTELKRAEKDKKKI